MNKAEWEEMKAMREQKKTHETVMEKEGQARSIEMTYQYYEFFVPFIKDAFMAGQERYELKEHAKHIPFRWRPYCITQKDFNVHKTIINDLLFPMQGNIQCCPFENGVIVTSITFSDKKSKSCLIQ